MGYINFFFRLFFFFLRPLIITCIGYASWKLSKANLNVKGDYTQNPEKDL